MDLIRSAYRARIALDPEGTEFQDIIWYFAPAGAKLFPGEHVFSSSNWLEEKDDPDGPGELVSPKVWKNGKSPGRYKGQHFCGPLEWWQKGEPASEVHLEPTTPRGEPLCCGPFGGAYSKAYSAAWDRID